MYLPDMGCDGIQCCVRNTSMGAYKLRSRLWIHFCICPGLYTTHVITCSYFVHDFSEVWTCTICSPDEGLIITSPVPREFEITSTGKRKAPNGLDDKEIKVRILLIKFYVRIISFTNLVELDSDPRSFIHTLYIVGI